MQTMSEDRICMGSLDLNRNFFSYYHCNRSQCFTNGIKSILAPLSKATWSSQFMIIAPEKEPDHWYSEDHCFYAFKEAKGKEKERKQEKDGKDNNKALEAVDQSNDVEKKHIVTASKRLSDDDQQYFESAHLKHTATVTIQNIGVFRKTMRDFAKLSDNLFICVEPGRMKFMVDTKNGKMSWFCSANDDVYTQTSVKFRIMVSMRHFMLFCGETTVESDLTLFLNPDSPLKMSYKLNVGKDEVGECTLWIAPKVEETISDEEDEDEDDE